jgi:hypothetical protein
MDLIGGNPALQICMDTCSQKARPSRSLFFSCFAEIKNIFDKKFAEIRKVRKYSALINVVIKCQEILEGKGSNQNFSN